MAARCHHVDMRERTDETRAVLAARGSTVENRQVLFLEERRAFSVMRPQITSDASSICDCVNPSVSRRIEWFESLSCASVMPSFSRQNFCQQVLVEHEADFERAEQLRLDLGDRRVVEALRAQRRLVDVRRTFERVRPLGERLDGSDLLVIIAEPPQRGFDRLVDDLKVAAAGKLLEFHQRDWLYAGGIAIHYKPDGACRRYYETCALRYPALHQLHGIVPPRSRSSHVSSEQCRALIGLIAIPSNSSAWHRMRRPGDYALRDPCVPRSLRIRERTELAAISADVL